MLTLDEFKLALPDKVRKSVNQELIDHVNTLISDPEMMEHYRNNLVSYTSVMKDGKFKIEQYLDAVRYVSFKLMGMTNIEAYSRAFPQKIANFQNQGVAAKDIASYVTAYNKGKLVNLIYSQTLVPVHVLNMDMYQKALNAQFELGMSADSEKVRSDALNSVLTQLKPPETKKVELDIGVKEDGSLNALRQTMMELAAQQRAMMEAKVITTQDAAHQKLTYIDVETKEV